MYVCINQKKIYLKPTQSIGKGGEADVYDIGGGKALKVFKQPQHPDYQNSPAQQQAARLRLQEKQIKLRQFPKNLPARVIQPENLATDLQGKTILGYTMALLSGTQVLMKYSERTFRAGISNQTVVQIFQDLHYSVVQIHKAGVVIGDFNDLNILVRGSEAYLIDADSFQYGVFLCQVFTTKFLDPLLGDAKASKLVLQKPYNFYSDWYAFSVLLMQSLLFVDPYGGVYKPKRSCERIPQEARALQRITVFHPEVKYPKPAIPYKVLPDELLDYFYQVFEKDRREEFPRSLLDKLDWKKCQNCQTEHARHTCPNCRISMAVITPLPEVTQVVRGKVTAELIFTTEGVILWATMQRGKLRWIYHEKEEFKREDGSVFISGKLDTDLQFRIQGKYTLIGKKGQVIALAANEKPYRIAAETFDANEFCIYWIYNGQLLRQGHLGAEYIGDVLANQTKFWVGNEFGFGFYRAGNLNVAFVFDVKRQGICDRIKLPPYSGQLIDATCTFSNKRCWFFWAVREQSQIINQCAVIHPDGSIEATASSATNSNSWLSTIHGKCAAGNFLFTATDDGIVRIETQNGTILPTKEFPDTEPFVDSSSQLFPSERGLYVVNHKQIRLLQII